MMIGGLSSSPTRSSRCSTMAGRVLSQRLDLYLEAGVGGGEHTVALALIALDPLLPAAWSHPQTMDEDDGVGSGRIGRVLGNHGVLLALLSAHACECAPYDVSAHRPARRDPILVARTH